MDKITLSIYNDDFTTIEKTAEAKLVNVPFGVVLKFMRIFDENDISDTGKLLKAICSSWNSLVAVLGRIFPDLSDDDWDRVDTGELVQCIVKLTRYAVKQMFIIPTEKN